MEMDVMMLMELVPRVRIELFGARSWKQTRDEGSMCDGTIFQLVLRRR